MFHLGVKMSMTASLCSRNSMELATKAFSSERVNFLSKHTGENARMLPNPNTKRWSAWFDSALYHADRYFLFGEFITEELSRGRNLASNSLLRLEEMYNDTNFMKKLHMQLNLVKVKGPTLMASLNYFQMRMPHVTRVHEKMQCLLQFLNVNAEASNEDFVFCFDGDFKFPCSEEEKLIEVAKSAFQAAHSKLAKYVVDGAQPASKFLEQVRVLDPTNLVDCERNLASIDSIPGMESVSKEEWKLCVDHIGPEAVKSLKDDEELALKQFWKSKASTLPELDRMM